MKKESNRRGKSKNIDMLPRKIRRNKVRNLIQKDGLTKINKRLKYYWEDIQKEAYKI